MSSKFLKLTNNKKENIFEKIILLIHGNDNKLNSKIFFSGYNKTFYNFFILRYRISSGGLKVKRIEVTDRA